MKNLDFKRCLQVIKWNIIANKKQIIYGTIAIAAAEVVIHCLNTGMLWRDNINALVVASTGNVIMTIGSIYLLLCAARINFNMQSKGDIINYAMLPATKLEKFWANWFMQVPLALAMLIVGIMGGDLVQMLISSFKCGEAYSITVQMITDGLPTFIAKHSSFLQTVYFFVGVFVFHATFLYGGVLFRRHPVILTVICWIVLPMAFAAAITGIVGAITYLLMDVNYDVEIEWIFSPATMRVMTDLVILLVEMCILTLLYWLTYRKFCRTQVINNRFYN